MLIFLSSCSFKNGQLEITDDSLEIMEDSNIEESNVEIESDLELDSEVTKITIEDLLEKYNSWEGNKSLGQSIYTLNLDNHRYILTILPNINNEQEIKWVELIYIKPIEEDTILSLDEIEPLEELISIVSPYSTENNQWIDKIISKDLPYEDSTEDWELNVDYYVYQGKREGVYVKLSNLKITTMFTPTIETRAEKRQRLANAIKEALNAPGHPDICTAVYFNSKGELIIEATSYWSELSKSDREDIIFLIKNILSKRKKELGVEGYGQFFSPSGRGLEAFYAD